MVSCVFYITMNDLQLSVLIVCVCSIWAIHSEESFAFSTKDRAPMFVCLEVVDVYRPSAEKRYGLSVDRQDLCVDVCVWVCICIL